MRTITIAVAAALALLAACSPGTPSSPGATKPEAAKPEPAKPAPPEATPMKNQYPVTLTEDEWKKKLTAEQYYVCRQKGTERPHGKMYEEIEKQGKGTYVCTACDNPLFKSETKYKSGTGWPSFFAPLEGKSVGTHADADGSGRDEVVCSRCGAHLGHVFPDGPRPTGLRYCMNGVSLKFVEEKKDK
jgi:peptide-methionine (R)-S-oxide reductase